MIGSHQHRSSLSVRCGPGVWSAITRTLVGRVVSVIVVLLRGGECRRSGRGLPRTPDRSAGLSRPGVGGLAPTGAASATSGRSTRRAWPRAERAGLTGRERRRTHRTRPAGAATAPRQPGSAHAALRRSLDRSPHHSLDLLSAGLGARRPGSADGLGLGSAPAARSPASGGVQVVDRPLGLAAGGDQGPGVLAEDGQPVAEVGGVVGRVACSSRNWAHQNAAPSSAISSSAP